MEKGFPKEELQMKITKKTAAMLCALGMCLSTMPKNVLAEEEIIEETETVAQDVTEEEIIEEQESTEDSAEERLPEEADNNVIAAEESFHYEIEENEHAEITVSRSNLGPNEYEVRVFPEEGYESWGIEIVNEAGEDVKFPTCTNVLALFFLTENVTIRAAVHPKDAVTYVDENGTRYVVPEYTDMSQVSDTDGVTLTDGWYVVSGQEVFENRININGDVNLVLLDGAKLTANKGIHNGEASNGHLTIWASSPGEYAGELEAYGINEKDASAIGGNEDENGGTINIHGGLIKAHGAGGAAGIGGGKGGNGGLINIYGGNLDLTHYLCPNYYGVGAGMGGGEDADGGVINIYGGHIEARGRHAHICGAAAGIGGGDQGNGGKITIHGGYIHAYGDLNTEYWGHGAGIGGGDNGNGGEITINGGTVYAEACSGAAIGGGDEGSSGKIVINGGTIHAYTEGNHSIGSGAAIGSGDEGDEAWIEIYGGDIYAKSEFVKGLFDDEQGAGIGSGSDAGTAQIYIAGGHIEAEGWEAIGGGNGTRESDTGLRLGSYMIVEGADNLDPVDQGRFMRMHHCIVHD